MFTKLIEGRRYTCGDVYNCCDCGGSGDENGGTCGCAYCFSCHACDTCLGEGEGLCTYAPW